MRPVLPFGLPSLGHTPSLGMAYAQSYIPGQGPQGGIGQPQMVRIPKPYPCTRPYPLRKLHYDLAIQLWRMADGL